MDPRYFLIATDGRHYGPLSASDVRTWLADGRANRYCRARRDGDTAWQPLREMQEFEAETRPPDVGFRLPDEAEARAEAQQPGVGRATGRLDPLSCFQRGWQVLLLDLPFLAGWTVLVSVIVGAAGMLPRVGLLVAFVTDQLLRGGLYVLYLSRMRGTPRSVPQVASLVAGSAVTILMAAIAQLVLAMLGLLLLIVPGIYLLVGYAFVLPLIVDKKLPVWDAMELSRTTVHRHWWPTFGLLLAQAALILLGALAAGIGLIVALPICTAALMVAYEDLFGEK
jgi:hypothetical protein